MLKFTAPSGREIVRAVELSSAAVSADASPAW